MPTKKKLPRRAHIVQTHYSGQYDWVNDPFSDPLEKLMKKNAKVKKKYPKKVKSNENASHPTA